MNTSMTIEAMVESLKNSDNGFLAQMTQEDLFELGESQAHNEEPLHLGGLDWNPENSEMKDLHRVFGAEVTDYGWSVINDTNADNVVYTVSFLMGAMSALGFHWVALQTGTYFNAYQEIDLSDGDEEIRKTLRKSFWLKLRFYPNRPSAEKSPNMIWENTAENAQAVFDKAAEVSEVIWARNEMWRAVFPVTGEAQRGRVFRKIAEIAPNVVNDGSAVCWPDDKISGLRHELEFYKNSLLLTQYGNVIAHGPEAILLA